MYALKSSFKGEMIALNQVEYVINEAAILKRCTHPFIPQLYATYRDADSIHMLLEYAPGGDLARLLKDRSTFNESMVTFYAASIVVIFEYLHDRRIVHRDLKPENLVLDAQGFLKIVDFGVAKEVITKAWTIVGTPEYNAPEIIMRLGHDTGSDWWSLGVLIYAFLVGVSPFASVGDPMQTYRNILKRAVPESDKLSASAKAIIDALLQRHQSERLGCMKAGTLEVRQHPLFKKLSWNRLERRVIRPPIVPMLISSLDVSAFDCENLTMPVNHFASVANDGNDHLFEDF